MEYQHGAHSVYDIKYHLIWVTKYRYQVLKGDIGDIVNSCGLDLRASFRSGCRILNLLAIHELNSRLDEVDQLEAS